MNDLSCTCTPRWTCTSNSLYSTLTTTQTAAATAQHKVKQQLTERAYIVSYWLGYLKPSHSPVGGAA